MKSLNNYITEKLKISKDNIVSSESISDRKELVRYITQVINNTDGDTLNLQGIDCTNITSLDSIFSIVDMPSYINKIDVSDWEVGKTIEFNNLFGGLYYVKEIIGLDTWDMSSAITINSMFTGCKNLKSLDLSNWDLKNLGNGDALNERALISIFMNCESLEEIIGIENWDVSRIRKINTMFFNCGIKKIDISNWDLSSCKTFNSVFTKCKNLEFIDMSNLKFSRQISKLTRAFEGCALLHTIKGIENLYVGTVVDLSSTFKDCKSLKADISNWHIPIYCTITCAFMYTNRKIFKTPLIFKKKQ